MCILSLLCRCCQLMEHKRLVRSARSGPVWLRSSLLMPTTLEFNVNLHSHYTSCSTHTYMCIANYSYTTWHHVALHGSIFIVQTLFSFSLIVHYSFLSLSLFLCSSLHFLCSSYGLGCEDESCCVICNLPHCKIECIKYMHVFIKCFIGLYVL